MNLPHCGGGGQEGGERPLYAMHGLWPMHVKSPSHRLEFNLANQINHHYWNFCIESIKSNQITGECGVGG